MTPAEAEELHLDRLRRAGEGSLAASVERFSAGLQTVSVPVSPLFVRSSDAARWRKDAEQVASAIDRLCRRHITQPLEDVSLEWPEKADAAVNWIPSELPLPSIRLDAVIDGNDDIHFVELNAGDPSGLGWIHHIATSMRTMDGVGPSFELGESPDGVLPLCKAVSGFTADLGVDASRWLFVIPGSSIVRNDFECLRDAMQDHIASSCVAQPWEVGEGSGGFEANGDPYSVVFRDALDEITESAHWPLGSALLRPHSRAVVVNPFWAAVADCKSWFAALHRPDVGALLEPEERDAVRRTVPFAEPVRPGEQRRDGWVRKPVYGWGGKGVAMGSETHPSAWEALMSRPGILQKRIISKEYRLALRPAQVARPPSLRCVLSIWIHAGAATCMFARVSPSHIVNVARDGALLPVIEVREPPGD